MPDVTTRIARLFVYPIKSCAGVELSEALLTDTGLDLDRAWMVVDAQGEFVTQRDVPRMALVKVQLKQHEVVLRAPGMLALHLSIDSVEQPVRVRVWDDEVPAFDMGAVAAQWFTDFLGQPLRLVRFDPQHQRLSSAQWTGQAQAANQFQDAFPLMVLSEGSLAELNRRSVQGGHFRPNIVLAGLEAQDEDRLDVIRIAADQEVQLRPVKPCARCPIPDIDPSTAEVTPHVSAMLQTYRANQLVNGAVTFGMNAIVVSGEEQILRVGQAVTADWRFAADVAAG
jgi:uncharacterized protein